MAEVFKPPRLKVSSVSLSKFIQFLLSGKTAIMAACMGYDRSVQPSGILRMPYAFLIVVSPASSITSWLGMAMHRKHPRRVLTALRVLLTTPKK